MGTDFRETMAGARQKELQNALRRGGWAEVHPPAEGV